MEWALRSDEPVLIGQARKELVDYLVRHAEPGSDLAVAELAFDELVGNACRHAPGPLWVQVDWTGSQAVLHVRDSGPGSRLAEALNGDHRGGLRVLADLCGPPRLEPGRVRGTHVSLALPVRRAVEVGPPTPHVVAPSPEAVADGVIGREAFLGALTVQLAQVLEDSYGPEAAEDAVAAVGSGVGARIEEEYRRARNLVGRMSPRQVADLLVTLKAAIGGDFRVLSLDEERIVLGNRRCPFGDAVTRAPALCSMTASVFGGIAARNGGHGAVTLEQRIAVGDPECRVVVALRQPSDRADDVEPAAAGGPADRVRAVLAEDTPFLRAPLVRMLGEAGVDVVAHCDDPDRVAGLVRTYRPDVLVLDLREGRTARAIEVAAEVRRATPGTGVLVLAERVAASSAKQLLGCGPRGVGYLLKSRLEDAEGFLEAVLSVARGGAAIDPEVVTQVARLDRHDQPLADLTRRELQVLHCLSEGLSNDAVADQLTVTKRAVEKHVGNIFLKLDLPPTSEQERRVLAVRAYLQATGALQV